MKALWICKASCKTIHAANPGKGLAAERLNPLRVRTLQLLPLAALSGGKSCIKLEKVAFRHFFDTLEGPVHAPGLVF